MIRPKCILLLSGGMDSTTLLGYLLDPRLEFVMCEIYPLSVNYGQKHVVELEAAKKVVEEYQKRNGNKVVKDLKILNFDLSQIGHSALTDSKWNIPENMEDQIQTVVPFRNTMLITLAAAYGESLGLNPINIYMTPVKEDFSAYRDCRRPFFTCLEKALSLGSTYGVEVFIHTPFVEKTKIEIVEIGTKLAVPYHLTHSCYKSKPACGKCPACVERLVAFEVNNLKDVIEYQKE